MKSTLASATLRLGHGCSLILSIMAPRSPRDQKPPIARDATNALPTKTNVIRAKFPAEMGDLVKSNSRLRVGITPLVHVREPPVVWARHDVIALGVGAIRGSVVALVIGAVSLSLSLLN